MDDLILPPLRRNEIPRVAACAVFFAVGVLMAIGGLAGAGGLVVVVIGGLCAAVFALPLLQGLHNLRTSRRLAAPRPEAPPPRESLEIPLKRGPRIFIAIAAVGFFAVVVVGIPWTIADADNPEVWLVIVLGLIWLVITAATGYAAYAAVKALWSRGLLLTDNGFTFDSHTWAWADIEDFKTTLIRDNEGNKTMQLRAVYRQDRPIASAPAALPFGLTDFKTDGRRIADILREWLQRYG